MIESSDQIAARPSRRRRRRRKSRAENRWLGRVEYLGTGLLHGVFSHVPPHKITTLLTNWGRLNFHLAQRRRQIALDNLRQVYQGSKSEMELKEIASLSIGSFILSVSEHSWFRRLLGDPAQLECLRDEIGGLDAFLTKGKQLHEETGGCIFVTPHFGVFGILPYLFSAYRIPLVIPINERSNQEINRRWCPLNMQRSPDGEVFVPKRNSFSALKTALREGRSVGMMADQRTRGGVSVDFLGRAAMTTSIPALLAMSFRRPIVVGACYRTRGRRRYEMVMADPIWPQERGKAQADVVRLTEEMNRKMGEIILPHPEQYFWVHERWKPDSRKPKLPIGRASILDGDG